MNLPAQNIATYSTFCSNPNCNETFDLDKATAKIQKSGIVYADCGEVIFQGYRCPNPNCRRLWFVSCDRNNPVFDLRDFIIIPNFHEYANTIEQLLNHKNSDNGHDFLKFNFIPAWNVDVPIQNFPTDYNRNAYDSCCMIPEEYEFGQPEGYDPLMTAQITEHQRATMGIPCLMTADQFTRRLKKEMETGAIQLRRLYPDTPKFRSLLTCLAPNRITEIDDSGDLRAEGDSAEEIQERDAAWRALLEEGGGKSLNEAIIGHLKAKGIDCPDGNEVESLIQNELFYFRRSQKNQLRKLAEKVGFEETIWNYFKRSFKEIFYGICTELVLAPHRKELTDWVNKAEKGKALFVDAPMGLGKTYSIVEALAENPELSAVIFMPTKKLCEEIIRRLKGKIAGNKGLDYWQIYHNLDNREFLESEVYYADGINPDECPHFDEIIKRYHQNWIKRQDLCNKCLMKSGCRFNSHWKEAPLSRIVVATHHKYDHFYGQSGIRKWYKDGYFKRDENGDIINGEDVKPIKLDGVERNFFIVDEDIVLSQCYQPFSLKYQELQDFLATVRDFVDQFSGTEEINNKIFNFFGRVGLCKKTSFIRPIDPKFRFPTIIREEWEESNRNLFKVLSNMDEPPEIVGNHLEMVEDAIRLGLVVQKYDNRNRIYFHNPKAYSLSKLPPHVFFDGTMIDKRFLKKKLRNVEFKKMKIRVKPLWDLRVWQNVNTDLPIRGINFEKKKVEQLLQIILYALGVSHKYLILSSKTTRNEYLKDFLKQNFSHFDLIPGYYGNLRGINDAKDCDVGIMLGSYIPSDAVEITMALEFIQNILPKKDTTITKNYFWTDKGSKGKRVYKRKYDIINDISRTIRYSEQRQAMARSRYIFHDVDFYVISKDPVQKYEPYAQIINEKVYEDLFPNRKERSDSKYEEVKEKILRLIIQEGKLGEMDIHRLTGHSRTTIRNHLKKMMDDDEVSIVRDGMKYTLLGYTLPKGV